MLAQRSPSGLIHHIRCIIGKVIMITDPFRGSSIQLGQLSDQSKLLVLESLA